MFLLLFLRAFCHEGFALHIGEIGGRPPVAVLSASPGGDLTTTSSMPW